MEKTPAVLRGRRSDPYCRIDPPRAESKPLRALSPAPHKKRTPQPRRPVDPTRTGAFLGEPCRGHNGATLLGAAERSLAGCEDTAPSAGRLQHIQIAPP